MDQEQNKAHFLAIYDAYADAVFRFCVLKVSSRDVAEDLTQDTFTRFWQSLRKGESIHNERAYLYTLARNLVIDWYRKKKESSLDALTELGIDFEGSSSESVTQTAEAREAFAVLNQLDDDARDLIVFRYVEGLSPKDIASILGETPNTISVRLHRAVKKVQELIHATS